ncbi:MAG: hypothetical protein M1828_000550 [Chrysothrix sp. TS-e1954]|nr:MAG: hypothetical protein M1828_000550 [Chrysothrix sp. TS-e1954]
MTSPMPNPTDKSTPTPMAAVSSIDLPRPTKRTKHTHTPQSAQSAALSTLFAKTPTIALPSELPAPRGPLPPPELVANVQGSSAGAGSGEFHVYKAARRREYERIRLMEEEARKEEEDRKWENERREVGKRDEEKVGKNRRRREKRRGRKEGNGGSGADEKGVGGGEGKVKREKGVLDGMEVDVDVEPKKHHGRMDAEEAKGVEEVGIVLHDDD